ncbi:riboflavin biosynthesis protein RibF [Akkermansiaceae bacterium]|nr:riboflavin biosynthesis protein RibF [Akkermansiaceae bacterium]MDA7898149.1 riboflavin biosynthesis protein RibF [Akkermansiaceae bacterium]MDB4471921.1 riboflavin biosynthesis protein RibF [Akkermansiaceae bacterium]MDB4556138.1 riboflavin biosynthesis protein RibF [Akkermansiaceae bacterium]
MQVLHGLKELSDFDRSFGLALGVFDGVHLGHQAVIAAARGVGDLGVLTFDPHPVQVLAPNHAPRRILSSLDQKKRLLSGLGVDFLVIIEFSPEFAAREARKFADDLFATGVKKLSAGDDWSFGRGREGNMQRLREWGSESGVDVLEISAILQDGLRISSTRIRKCLQEEDLDSVATMLGRHYSVLGTVVRGRQLGRTIGFPTANVVVADEVLPPNGVYVVEGNGVPGVANIGTRPTVDDSRGRSLEVHLFTDDLPMDYGWELEVGFLRKIRDEQKFQSLEELRNQIQCDVQNAQRG